VRPGETLVQVTKNAPWLPPGGRAEAFRGGNPPRPMSMVRLLLVRGDEVFCVARPESGRLDLPTRMTGDDDPTGIQTVATLAHDVIGALCDLTFVGAVRNVVATGTADYAWPTPEAHFGLWTTAADPAIEGEWLTIAGEASSLREKHWYPIVAGVGAG